MSLVLVTSSEWYSRPLLLFIHLHWLISVPVLALQASLAVLPWDTAVLQCLTTAMGGVAWVRLVTRERIVNTETIIIPTQSSLYWAPVRMKLSPSVA